MLSLTLALTALSAEPLADLDLQWHPQDPPARRLARVATLGALQWGAQYATLMISQPPNWQDHGNSLTPSWAKFQSNFGRAPVWEPETMGGGGPLGWLQADGDAWTTNVLGHALQGSEIHVRMRREGFSPGAAAIAGVVHSTLWEYAVEGWNETPSAWDLAWTPVGGWLLGEARYRAWHWLGDRRHRPAARAARILLDPVGELVDAPIR